MQLIFRNACSAGKFRLHRTTAAARVGMHAASVCDSVCASVYASYGLVADVFLWMSFLGYERIDVFILIFLYASLTDVTIFKYFCSKCAALYSRFQLHCFLLIIFISL